MLRQVKGSCVVRDLRRNERRKAGTLKQRAREPDRICDATIPHLPLHLEALDQVSKMKRVRG